MEPCGTPCVITSQELYVILILVRCVLSEKQLCISINDGSLKLYALCLAIIRS